MWTIAFIGGLFVIAGLLVVVRIQQLTIKEQAYVIASLRGIYTAWVPNGEVIFSSIFKGGKK